MNAAISKVKAAIIAVRVPKIPTEMSLAGMKVRAERDADNFPAVVRKNGGKMIMASPDMNPLIADPKAGSGMSTANLRAATRVAIIAGKIAGIVRNIAIKTAAIKTRTAASNHLIGALPKIGNATTTVNLKTKIIKVAAVVSNRGDRVPKARRDEAAMNPASIIMRAAIGAANVMNRVVLKMRAAIATKAATTNGPSKMKTETGTASKIPAANPATIKVSPIAASAIPRFMMTRTARTGDTLKMIPTRRRTMIIPVRVALVSGNLPIPVGENRRY